MESTITLAFAPTDLLDLIATCLDLNAVTRIHAKTVEPVQIHLLLMDITLVIVNLVGLATIANSLWTGAKNRLVKTEPDAHKGEHPMNAIA